MNRTTGFAAVAALATMALAACSDNMVQPPLSQRAAPTGVNRLITPVLTDVIVGTGTFANAIQLTEAFRTTPGTAFYGNASSDDGNPWPNANHCNIGYFAQGTGSNFGPICINYGHTGSTPGGYANYYGFGTGNLDSPPFMFKGTYSFDVKIVGAFSFGQSTVGWFTKDALGVYTLHAVAEWSTKQMGFPVTINTLGQDWGFFAQNSNFTGVRNCGATTNTTCSDASGGFGGPPIQQHALFINSTGDQFLVALEDNLLGLWHGDCNHATGAGGPLCSPDNPTNQDSDYNDYIFNVVPHVIPGANHGCTLGFWKNHTGLKKQDNAWPSPYVPGVTTLGGAGFVGTGNQGTTMLDALSFGGGPSVQDAKNLLMQQAVAALLNAATPGMNYPLTVAQVLQQVNAALATNNRDFILGLQSTLDADNSLEGPLC
jgi:hypothetical protein